MTTTEIGAMYRARVLDGSWTPDMAEQLLSGAVDPGAVVAEFQRQNQDPRVRSGLAEVLAQRRAPPPRVRSDAAGQARDHHGRFASGHGAAHDAARVAAVRSEATQIARASGHADHVARGEHEAAKEHATITNEHRALAAGHVAPVPTAKLAAYDTAHAHAQARAAELKQQLDVHQAHAAAALATLRAHPEHEQHDIHDPTDAHEQASSQLGHVAGHHGETSYEAAAGNPAGSYREHAIAAQDALEALHGHQLTATAELKQVDREHERAAGAMLREAERHAEHGVRVAEGHPEHAAASAAAESLSGHEATRREDISSPMRTRIEDAHAALREATRSTATTVRELAGITGRKPKLAGK